MYDLLFVRKRRRRRIAALVALFTSIGITSLVIISFLGRSVGTFTVSLKNSEVKLALCETKDSTNYSTYLHVNENSPYIPRSYYDYEDEILSLDDESVQSKHKEYTYVDETDGKTKTGTYLEFFKYTFYVKNIGDKTASYKMKVVINNITKAEDGSDRGLDDILRVMVFENKPDSTDQNYKIYAKKTPKYANYTNYDIDGNETDRELIAAVNENTHETEKYRLAEKFDEDDNRVITTYDMKNFTQNQMMRYTIVLWLEGDDQQCNRSAPDGATLKIGVDIDAKEGE